MLTAVRATRMGTLLAQRCNSHTSAAVARTACKVGDIATATKCISKDDVNAFAHLSGDTNPIHVPADDQQPAVVHGALLNGLVSGVIGTQLPGAGTLVVSQSLNFPAKCHAGDVVRVRIEVTDVRKIIKLKFDCCIVDEACSNSSSSPDNKTKCVLYGEAKVVQR